jgi:hypothetical protein
LDQPAPGTKGKAGQTKRTGSFSRTPQGPACQETTFREANDFIWANYLVAGSGSLKQAGAPPCLDVKRKSKNFFVGKRFYLLTARA